MMREELAQLDGTRWTWRGEFVRFGEKHYRNHRPQATVLLWDVEDMRGERVADHLWLNLTREFSVLDLKKGDRVEFEARVKRYRKRNRDGEDDCRWTFDWKLANPTKVRKLTGDQAIADLPLFKELSPQRDGETERQG